MKFNEARYDMLKGKKITTDGMGKDVYLFIKNDRIMHRAAGESEEYSSEISNSYIQSILVGDYKDDEWEIVEEKKTLSDKEFPYCHSCRKNAIETEDVKESLKEFFDKLTERKHREPIPYDLAKEIFGERLIE